MTEDLNLIGIGVALLSSLGGSAWFWYDKNRKIFNFSDLSKTVGFIKEKQIAQENTFITESRAREILKEEIVHLRKDISDVKIHVTDISTHLTGLVADIRVLTAVQI